MKVITRFAPSPTGFLHIGGARTALFNYLFSKHYNGKFLLRIEDTDQKRSTKEAVDAILNSLSWLNLDWDGDAVMQSHNSSIHKKAALDLLQKGAAYYCYCPPKRLTEETEQQTCNCNNLKHPLQSASSAAIRLRVSKEGFSSIEDLVVGKVSTPKKDIEDFIILRADGTPTYLLAAVVDDINMEITHVIRGNDHLSNTFKQKEIFEALGKPLPFFAHIPLIHGEDGSKLSKRHGALGVEEYKNMGYINTAINNYLLKLGWSFNNQDIVSKEDAIKNFDIKTVQKSPARFDFNKLDSINAYYIKHSSTYDLLNLLNPFIINIINNKNKILLENYQNNLKKVLPFLQTRFKTLNTIAEAAIFIIIKNIDFSEEAKKAVKDNIDLLRAQELLLQKEESFTRNSIHDVIKNYATQEQLKLGDSVYAIRAALCGEISSPASVFDIMDILGKDESLLRINNAIKAYK